MSVGDKGDQHASEPGRRLARRIQGVKSRELRRGAIGLFVKETHPASCVQVLEDLLWRSLLGSPSARDLWLSVAQWLVSRAMNDDASEILALRQAAREAKLPGLAAILQIGKPRRVLPDTARKRQGAALDAQDVVFPMNGLSNKGWALRGTYPKGFTVMLDRPRAEPLRKIEMLLTGGPSLDFKLMVKKERILETTDVHLLGPSMTRRLIGQHWLELKDILLLATKRPLNHTVAFEAVLSSRWCAHPKLHEALACNPFSPPEVVLPLLPILPRRVLGRLSDAGPGESVLSDGAQVLLGAKAATA